MLPLQVGGVNRQHFPITQVSLNFLHSLVKGEIVLTIKNVEHAPCILSQHQLSLAGLALIRASSQNDTLLRHCEADEASRSNLGDGQEIAMRSLP